MNTIEQVTVQCPYCGESIELEIDCSIFLQNYIEDCQVCCKPMTVDVSIDRRGFPVVIVKHENDV